MLDNWLIDLAFIGVTLTVLFGLEYVTGRKMFGRTQRAHLACEEASRCFGTRSLVLLGITVVVGCAAVAFLYI